MLEEQKKGENVPDLRTLRPRQELEIALEKNWSPGKGFSV